jgi:hypothetical protein
LVIFFFQALFLSSINAQRLEDVVYLSNGSIIRGTEISDSTSGKIKILNHSGDIWVFDRAEVDSLKHEKPLEYKAMLFNRPGLELGINGALMIRSGSNAIGNAVIPGMNFQLGYRFDPYLSAGGELGMEFYERMEIPVSAFIKLRSNTRSLSPLLILRAGYTIPGENRPDDWSYSYESFGGVHSTVGAGIERILNANASFLFTFSYHHQKLKYHLTPLNQWEQERDRTEAYSRLRITLGYIFR